MLQIHCKVISCDKKLLDQEVSMVVAPGVEGEVGILGGHAPMIMQLKDGQVKIYMDTGVIIYHINGGFMHVATKSCVLLIDVD